METVSEHSNFKAFLISNFLAAGYVALCGAIGKRRLLPKRLSRKMMHMGAGPLFVLCWPLFAPSPWSPALAASVPFLASVLFAVTGMGSVPDVLGLVPGATRTGQRRELMRGPLFYGLVHSAVAVLGWCSPGAVLAIAVLCFGDGLAEVVGASVASPRLPWNREKSTAGSFACWVGGTGCGVVLLMNLERRSALIPQLVAGAAEATSAANNILPGVALCALIGTVIESLPLRYEGIDNVTVPVAVMFSSRLILGG